MGARIAGNVPRSQTAATDELANSERAEDSLRALETADRCATGPSRVRTEVRPGEFRRGFQAGVEARQSLPRLHPIAPELLRERLRQLA